MVLVATAGVPAARAEARVETKIIEFDVPGANAAEVAAGFDRSGQFNFAGHPVYAKTLGRFTWTGDYVPTDKGCALTDVVVTAEITISMPRFVDAPRMSPRLKRAFSVFSKNLLGHERGHEKRFAAAVQRIEKRLRGLSPQPSCEQTRERVGAIGYDVFQEMDQSNRAYDKREEQRTELKFPTD